MLNSKTVSFTANVTQIDNKIWNITVPIPTEISQYFIKNGEKRVVCTINETESFQAGLLPKGDGTYFILLNKARCKKLNLQPGDEVNVVLQKDESKYGLPMPEEMQELLNQDPEGDVFFHKLTPGKQRSLLHIIGKPKSSTIRLNKALTVLNYLKSTGGKLDFKELNIAFKENKF